MKKWQMTEQAAWVLTEWIHTLARELCVETKPLSPQKITAAMAGCCPDVVVSDGQMSSVVLAVDSMRGLHPDIPIADGREAVFRLESALPKNLSESQKKGYFSFLLSGLSSEDSPLLRGLEKADGVELRQRLSRLLEETADRILEDMAELSASGACGSEPVPPEPLEGILQNQQIFILAAAVFCTAAEGVLGEIWKWPSLVSISLTADEQFVLMCAQDLQKMFMGRFSGFYMLQEHLYRVTLLSLTAFFLQIFTTSGGELDIMQQMRIRSEEWPSVLSQQMYGLLGHISGYRVTKEQAASILRQTTDGLSIYQIYAENRKRAEKTSGAQTFAKEQSSDYTRWGTGQDTLEQWEKN